MFRIIIYIVIISLSCIEANGSEFRIVADSATHQPLPGATVFDSKGNGVGICNAYGRMPHIPVGSYPLTLRCIGYKEKRVDNQVDDTIFLSERASALPEVVIESKNKTVLHILAYVREYSNLTSYSDTVFLFREKMVDFMLPTGNSNFKGWRNPRVLKSKSYYRFTNTDGKDSVSDKSHFHFSWSDWVELPEVHRLPVELLGIGDSTLSRNGKYSPYEIWRKSSSGIILDVDALADSEGRKWVPNFSTFFGCDNEFEQFKLKYTYESIEGEEVSPLNLKGYSIIIESAGRGHRMFRFNSKDEPFFVSTYAELYVLDKEFITQKEAGKWERCFMELEHSDIIRPDDFPEPEPSVLALIERVNSMDGNKLKLDMKPDYRVGSMKLPNSSGYNNIGKRALTLLKDLTGITAYKSRKNMNKRWNEFKKEQMERKEDK